MTPHEWTERRIWITCPGNCNRHSFRVGPLGLYVSYNTVVGVDGPDYSSALDFISVTTSKHQSELRVRGLRVAAEEFHARLVLAAVAAAKELLKELAPLIPAARATAKKAEASREKATVERAAAEDLRTKRKAAKAAKEAKRLTAEARKPESPLF